MSRKSNFELLRIFAMVFIISGHMVDQAGVLSYVNSSRGGNQYLIYFMGYGARIAVNLFLLTGAWFMVDNEFSSKRVLRIYGETWYYAFSLTFVMFVIRQPIGIKDIMYAIAPFIRRTFWYSSAYLALLLMAPFLKQVFLWKKNQIRALLMVLTFLICFFASISKPMDNWMCYLVWFSYVFLCVGYYKKYLLEHIKINGVLLIIVGLSIYILCVTVSLILYQIPIENTVFKLGYKIILQYLKDYKSALNYMISILIFGGFVHIQEFSSKCVNQVAASAYGVYLFHQVPCFYPWLWFSVFKIDKYYENKLLIPYLIFVVCTVYFFGVIYDIIRKRMFEPVWLQFKGVKFVEKKINQFYDNLEMR